MTPNDALATFRTVLGYIAIALAVCAAAKLFGMRPPVPGSISELALVAVALKMV